MTARGSQKTRRGPSSRMTSMGGLCPSPSSGSTSSAPQPWIARDQDHTLNERYRVLFLFYRRPIMGAGQPLKGGLDMNRHTAFGSPYLLGFEHLERLLERTARNA